MFSTVCPFISEKIYQNLKHILKTDEMSIHGFDWPDYDAAKIDDSLEKDMQNISSVIQGILYAREKAQLGVRWPIKSVAIVTKNEDVKTSIEKLSDLIKKQTNIKTIEVMDKIIGVKTTLKPDYTQLGKSFGEKTQLIAQNIVANQDRIVEEIEKASKAAIEVGGNKYELIKDHLVFERDVPDHLQDAEFKDGIVYLDKTRTPELEAEGFAREMIRRVQSLRKKQDMQRSESIELFLQVPEDMVDSLADHISQIKSITGSSGLMVDANAPDKKYPVTSKEKIKAKEVTIYFKKV